MTQLADFLPAADTTATYSTLTAISKAMQGSLILQIAGEVRGLIANGQPVCNLTVGDFDAKQFPIPGALQEAVFDAYRAGQTNYPPSEGIPELRNAIVGWYKRQLNIEVAPDWIVVAAGARPVMYATARLFLEAGDTFAFAVPSWNNGYYAQLCGARAYPVPTKAENNFFPTPDELRPALRVARLFSLNSPLNPTGTVIRPDQLRGIAELVVEENQRRQANGDRALIWMWDQVYWQLTYGDSRHLHPTTLVPEVTPYIITVDAISKAFAATGLRVGWAMVPPNLAERMKSLLGHVGAWAPRPEQLATARLLDQESACAVFNDAFRGQLSERLSVLSKGLTELGIEHLVPQGAMYLSVRFSLFGRRGVDGQPMRTNEDIRKFLLQQAGLAIVPFQAFDMTGDTGWFRMSVGAVSVAALQAAFARLRAALAA